MEALLELLENIGDFDDLVLMLESYGINLEERRHLSSGCMVETQFPPSKEAAHTACVVCVWEARDLGRVRLHDVMTDIYNCEE